MSLVLKDRVLETCTSPGTGTITLLGAVTGYQAFSVVGNGNTCYYAIADQNGANWECGIGTYSSGTLARTTVLSSSNAGSLTNFSTGTQNVFLTYPSERSVNLSSAALTSGRVTYATTDGLLTDSANLVFTGTNLGVGTSSPSDLLTVQGTIRTTDGTNYAQFANNFLRSYASGTFYFDEAVVGQSFVWRTSSASSLDTTALTLTSSGNLGLGVTPSPFSSGRTVLEIGGSTTGNIAFNGNATNGYQIWCNSYFNSGNFYYANGLATNFGSGGGTFFWNLAPNNTSGAGAVATFTRAMTLDASGNLGIGTTSPAAKLQVNAATDTIKTLGTSYNQQIYDCSAGFSQAVWQYIGTSRALVGANSIGMFVNTAGDSTAPIVFGTGSGSTERMRIDSSGNLGLGVTPSAWDTTAYIAMQLPSGGSLAGYKPNNVPILQLSSNWYYDNANKYVITGLASQYTQAAGIHSWSNAPSGSPGGTITFTQAMTLDTNGFLSIGTTSAFTRLTTSQSPGSAGQVNGQIAMTHAGATTAYFISTIRGAATNEPEGLTFKENATERMRISSTGTLSLSKVNGSAIIRREVAQGSYGLIVQGNAADTIDDTNPGASITIGGGPLTDTYEGNITIIAYGAVSGTGNRNAIEFRNRSGVNTTTERMRIDYLGNVGIGTTSPGSILHISAPDPSLRIQANTASGVHYANIDFYTPSGANVATIGTSPYGGNAAVYNRVGAGWYFTWEISGTAKMTLQSSGRLSVGNTTDYGGIILTPPPDPWGEGFIINPASNGYSGVYLRVEGATGSSYTGTWVLAKNSSAATGGETLNIAKESLTASTNFTNTSAMCWTTGGNTLVGFNMQIGSTTSLYASGKLQITSGKAIINSTDSSYTQLQIGNPTSGGEAGVTYISGATGYGPGPTSVNGDTYIWAAGAGVYGLSGDNWAIGNKSPNSYVAKIAYNSTSWTFSSDERLKDLDGEITNAIDKVSGLRAVYYTWKNDEAKKRKVGLIAQYVLKVLPEAVDKPEQETSEKGYTNYLGLGMSDVVPLLVAAIKEQQALIESLTTRLTALENK